MAGGKAASRAPPTQEMYSISLSSFDEWRKEPSYPRSGGRDGFFGWTMVVHDHKAYVINGLPNVDYFDLKTNKWSSIPTKFKPKKADRDAGLVGKWPWLGVLSQATAQATKDGKIYVFGGVTLETNIGCNLFMELDLKTKLWRRLSGYPKVGSFIFFCVVLMSYLPAKSGLLPTWTSTLSFQLDEQGRHTLLSRLWRSQSRRR